MSGLQVDLRLGAADNPRLAVRFGLDAGTILGVWGASGAGKTTLLRSIAGLEPGATGSVRFAGADWLDTGRGVAVPVHRRGIGFVFQHGGLFPHLDVAGNLAMGRRGGPGLGHGMLAELGLEALLGRPPAALSGGERRRVELGRALARRPGLLLLDEALGMLDDRAAARMLDVIGRLCRQDGLTVVLVSHRLPDIARVADRLLVLEAGRVRLEGPLPEYLLDPSGPVAADTLAGVPLRARVAAHDDADGLTALELEGGGAELLWTGRLQRPVGDPVRLFLHARDVSLARQRAEQSSILNSFAGEVRDSAEVSASHVLVRVGLNGQDILARITRRSRARLALEPGTRVYVQVKSVSLARD